jgi:hypothetical protein
MSGGPAKEQGASIAENFSLVIGGPSYLILRRTALLGPRQTVKGVLVWLLLTWGPLLGLCLAAGTAWGNRVRIPLLYDFATYGRFFFALPLLIAAEFLIDPYLRQAVLTLNFSDIIRSEELPAYHASLQRVAQLRDSSFMELFLALLAFFPFFLLLDNHDEWMYSQVSTWHGAASQGLSPAGWWFVLAASPLVRFLMLRWLWRYALWSYLLRNVSRLHLDLLATHPDRMGGLYFLLRAQQHFGFLATALGSVVAGQLANEIVHLGRPLSEIRGPAVVFTILSVLIVLFPLAFFSLRLFQARRDGLERYNLVARSVTTKFDVKWARGTGSPPESMIGTQEPSSLIDYISTYDVIRSTRVIPISKRAIIYIAALAAAPFAFVWLIVSPLDKLIAEILRQLL